MDKIPIGSICMVDPENHGKQKEPSVKFVQVMQVIKDTLFQVTYKCLALHDDLKTPIEVCNQSQQDESPKEWLTIEADHSKLKILNKGDRIVLRYPYWIPPITHGDLQTVTMALKMLDENYEVSDPKVRKMWFNKLSALEVKLSYYLKMLEV